MRIPTQTNIKRVNTKLIVCYDQPSSRLVLSLMSLVDETDGHPV